MVASSDALPKHAAMVNGGGVDGYVQRAQARGQAARVDQSVPGRLARPQRLVAQATQRLQRMIAALRDDVVEALPLQRAHALQRRVEVQVGQALGPALPASSGQPRCQEPSARANEPAFPTRQEQPEEAC